MRVEVDVDQKLLETFGTLSLTGVILSKLSQDQGFGKEGDVVVLKFHTSSLTYCRNHSGPRTLLMPDYAPMCLIENILGLSAKGVKFEIVEVQDN